MFQGFLAQLTSYLTRHTCAPGSAPPAPNVFPPPPRSRPGRGRPPAVTRGTEAAPPHGPQSSRGPGRCQGGDSLFPARGLCATPRCMGRGLWSALRGSRAPGATWRVAPSVGHGGCSGKFRFGRVTECAVLVSRTERESHWTSAPPYRAWTGSASSWRRRTPPEGEVSGAPGSPGPLTGQEAWETRATPWEPRTPEGRDRPAAPVSQTQRPGPRSGTQRPGPRSSQGAGGRGGRQRTHSVRGRRPSL